MKPKFTVSAILLLMSAAITQMGTAQQAQDLHQGSVTDRQETQGDITYTLKDDLTFSDFQTEDTISGGSVFFNQIDVAHTPPNQSTMTFTGAGMSMSFDNCSSINNTKWINPNEGGGAIRAEMLIFTDMGDISFNNCRSIVNTDTNAGGAINARGDVTFSQVGNISFTNNTLGNDGKQGQALGGALFAWGTVNFKDTGSILFSNNSTGQSPHEDYSNIGGAIHAGASNSGSENLKDYIPDGDVAVTFQNINGSITFEGNSAWMAGAIYAYAGTVDGKEGTGGGMKIDTVAGDVIFKNNAADSGALVSEYNGNYGAIYSGQDLTISNVQGDLRFDGNRAANNAGAFGVSGNVILNNIGSITFINNSAGNTYAVGWVTNDWTVTNTGDITISDNSSGKQMGGIAVFGKTSFAYTGDITIKGNSTGGSNGALRFYGDFNVTNAGDISISENNAGNYNGALEISGNTSFTNTGKITMDGNKAGWGYGVGQFQGDLTFANTRDISISGNKSIDYSYGALAVKGETSFTNTGKITIDDNTARWNGGAALFEEGVTFANTGDISISGNSADNYSGAMEVTGDTSFTNTGKIALDNNTAGWHYGVGIFRGDLTFANTGDISISGNKSTDYGYGALVVEGEISLVNTGKVTISENTAKWDVGALQANNGLEFINNRGGVLIENNAVDGVAGAMYLAFHDAVFSADQGDIIVKGNTEKRGGDNPILNSIVFGTDGTFSMDSVALRAQEGNSVTFYDPFRNGGDGAEYDNIAFDLNKSEDVDATPYDGTAPEFAGTIRFSGAEADKLITQAEGESEADWQKRLDESKYFNVSGKTTLYDGTLILEDGVTYGNSDLSKDSSFTVKKGTLEITGNSSVNSNAIALESGVTLRTGRGATFRADTVDISKGVIFDFRPFMDDYSSGLHIEQASSHTMGGLMGVADSLSDYAHNRWATEQHFLAISIGDEALPGTTGDFDDIYSSATGTNVVDSPYTYAGYWTKEWTDEDGDGINEHLYAVWNPTAKIKEILPELAGSDIGNSMWSSASNIKSVSNAALGQVGITRFLLGPENNFWIKGLGDFTYHATHNGIDGYDYNGGGYAVGADRRFTPNTILGAAFGNLYGTNKSRTWISEVDQTSYTALLYGAWRKQLSPNNAITINGSAGFGWVTNKLDSYYEGGASHGKWQNRMGFATLQATWDHNLNKSWTLSPFLGIEYTQVNQNSFTETGYDARHFDRGDLKNLSLPVGVGISKSIQFSNGVQWVNSLAVSYVPDVMRNDPKTQATRLLNDFTWTSRGVRPDRNAVRVNYNSTLVINPRWTTYAGYEFEGRNKSTYHRVNAGVSYAF